MEKIKSIISSDRVEKFVFAVGFVGVALSAVMHLTSGNFGAFVGFLLTFVWMSLYWQVNQHSRRLRDLLDDVLDEYGKTVELLKSIGEAINAAKDEPVQVNPEK